MCVIHVCGGGTKELIHVWGEGTKEIIFNEITLQCFSCQLKNDVKG